MGSISNPLEILLLGGGIIPSGVYPRTKPAWNKGLTTDDPRVAAMVNNSHATSLKRYGVSNVLQSKEVLDRIADDRHSGRLAQKAKETKQARYGDPNYNNMERSRQTKLDRYGDPYYNNMEKMFQTKRSHRTFNTSKPEEDYYSYLLTLYPEEDIFRQYRDPRYPYCCDFYIKSEDLFIELNYHQSHGLHPYNPENQDDQDLVSLWMSKQNADGPKNQYWAYVDTFTVKDPQKLQCAIKNHLNYLLIYRNGLEIKI